MFTKRIMRTIKIAQRNGHNGLYIVLQSAHITIHISFIIIYKL